MIKSSKNILSFKYPILRILGNIGYFLYLILWICGLIIGLLFYSKEGTNQLLIWNVIWLVGGTLIFRYSFWNTVGTQQMELQPNFLRIRKILGPFQGTKKIRLIKIENMEIKTFKPYNLLTGKDISTSEQLGYLVINFNGRTKEIPYLYPVNELNNFITEFKNMR